LREFLFGAERNAFGVLRPVLMDLQHGKCFYCSQPVGRDSGHVDRFIPWAKYPIDLGHNFVLGIADATARSVIGYRMSITWPDGASATAIMLARSWRD
jgi:hypothetical protein